MMDKLNENLSKVLAIVGVSLIAISCFVVFLGYNDYQEKLANNQKELAEIQAKVDSSEGSTEQISEELVQEQVHSVKSIGEELAFLENQRMMLISTSHQKEENYDEESTYAECDKIAVKMEEYFGTGSILKSAWYSGDLTKMGSENCWSFMNSYDFSENTISVLWLCKDAKGTVVAYVTADYHAKDNSFDNVEKHQTIFGNYYIGVTGDDGKSVDDFNAEAYASGIQNMLDTLGVSDEEAKRRDEMVEEQKEAKENNDEARYQLEEELKKQEGDN